MILAVWNAFNGVANAIGRAAHAAHLPAGTETIVVLLLIIGADVAVRRARTALRPIETELRLWRAALRLQRARVAITPGALATAARVSYDAALAWLAKHPQFMPSPMAAAR
jgi:hypothetical protein